MNVVVNMDNIFKNNIRTLKKINKLKFSIEIAIGKKSNNRGEFASRFIK
jgi:hypothetical protein